MKGGSQTVTQNVDPQTQAYVNQLRQYALGATGLPTGAGGAGATAGASGVPSFLGGPLGPRIQVGGTRGAAPTAPFQMPGLPPEILAAQEQYGRYANAGNLGLTALTGGANPFYDASQQQALEPLFAEARQRALGDINQQATLASAFGGSRQGVAQGQALGTLGSQQAGLGYQAYQDSLQRALQAAQLGFGASERSAFLPQQFYGGQLGLLNQALGPYGTTQTTQMRSDPFSQLLGLGLTGFSLFGGGPLAAAAGGLGTFGIDKISGGGSYG